MFRLGKRSRANLVGVHPDLVRVAELAITLTSVDFVIYEGRRTTARQAQLVASGASQTMDSRHITGHAIDVAAWLGEVRWDFGLYVKIAEAFREAADELAVQLEWGACWRRINHAPDLQQLVTLYVQRCRDLGKKPFIDGPHFQLPRIAAYA